MRIIKFEPKYRDDLIFISRRKRKYGLDTY